MQGRQNSVIAQGWLPAGNHAFPLAPALPKQAGILSVTIGQGPVFIQICQYRPSQCRAPKNRARPSRKQPCQDCGRGGARHVAGHKRRQLHQTFVYTFVDTMDFWVGGSDPYTEYRQQCMHRINYYRSSVGLGCSPVTWPKEACADSQCQSDAAGGIAHGAFGKCGESAQDECPGWGSFYQ